MRAKFADVFDVLVIFIRNFANKFFNEVFQGDQACDAAVFVDNHGHMVLFLLQIAQRVIGFFALRDEQGGFGQFVDRCFRSGGRFFMLDPRHIAQITNPHYFIAVFTNHGHARNALV